MPTKVGGNSFQKRLFWVEFLLELCTRKKGDAYWPKLISIEVIKEQGEKTIMLFSMDQSVKDHSGLISEALQLSKTKEK